MSEDNKKNGSDRRNELERALDYLDQGILVVDEEFRILLFNKNFLELLEFPPGLIKVGTPGEAVFRFNAQRGEYGPGEVEEQVRERMELARKFLPHKFERRRPDGTVIEVVGKPLPGGGFVSTFTDVTARRQATEAISERQAYISGVLSHVADGVITIDSRGLVKSFNPAAAAIFGYAADEVVGKNISMLVPEPHRGNHDGYIAAYHETGEGNIVGSGPREVSAEHKNGEIFPLDLSVNTMTVNGEVEFVGVVRDISERKRIETAMREREALLAEAQRIAHLGNWDRDLVSGKLRWSDETYRIFGLAPGQIEATTRAFLNLVHPEDLDRVMHWREHSIRVGTANECDHRVVRPDGTERVVRERAETIRDKDGNTVRVIGTVLDITEQKRVEIELKAAKERADEGNRAKSEFLANMSHELRTPLNAIIGFSRMIADAALGPVGVPKYQEYAEDIHESGLHLLALIGDILDLSKIEAGKAELADDEVDITPIVESCVKIVRKGVQHSDLEIETRISDNLPKLRADARKVKQVILNLLSNAAKFTLPGGRVTISARLKASGSFVIEVADTGIGIAPDDVPTAMEPFGQVDCGFDRKFEGTGLGLPLSKSLVELHGGTLELESAPGIGTTVTVCLPSDRVRWRAA